MARRIAEKIPEEVLQEDLERYRRRAIELGAADAQIIPAENVLIDERVRMKCFVPACSALGKNAHCPPHGLDLDFMRKAVSRFRYAVFFMIRVPAGDLVGPGVREKRSIERSAMKNWEICGRIESEAFHDGYHFATAFAGGPCDPYLCRNEPCALLKGEGCRHPFRSRPSMEGVGMDVFTMAARAGWEIYPLGSSTSPSEVPHGLRLGIILIH
jgi:predicted metal-binding protein